MTVRELLTIINPHCLYQIMDRDGTIYKLASSDFSDWSDDKDTKLPDYILNAVIYTIKNKDNVMQIVLKGLGD